MQRINTICSLNKTLPFFFFFFFFFGQGMGPYNFLLVYRGSPVGIQRFVHVSYVSRCREQFLLSLVSVQSGSYLRQSVYRAIPTFVSKCTEQFLLSLDSVRSNSYFCQSVYRAFLTFFGQRTDLFSL